MGKCGSRRKEKEKCTRVARGRAHGPSAWPGGGISPEKKKAQAPSRQARSTHRQKAKGPHFTAPRFYSRQPERKQHLVTERQSGDRAAGRAHQRKKGKRQDQPKGTKGSLFLKGKPRPTTYSQKVPLLGQPQGHVSHERKQGKGKLPADFRPPQKRPGQRTEAP